MSTRLDTPVDLLQNAAEFAELLDLYRERAPKRVLEIGSYEGGSMFHWVRLARPGAIVVSVDLDQRAGDRYGAWAAPGVRTVAIVGDSTVESTVKAAAVFAPYDWIFIDADHHTDYVRADWEHYGALAAPGAIVAFHDVLPSRDPSIEVAPLWAEIRAEHETREIAALGGLGIGVVFVPLASRPESA